MTKNGWVWFLTLLCGASTACTGEIVLCNPCTVNVEDAGPTDSGPADKGPLDIGPADMGPADMAEADAADITEQWSRQYFIKAPRVEVGGNFGGSLAIGGDELLIGSPGSGYCGPNTDREGYVCSRRGTIFGLAIDGSTNPNLRAALPPDLPNGSNFGSSVAANTEWVIVGSDRFMIDGTFAGAAFVFDSEGNMQTLTADEARLQPRFGSKVAMSESWVAVLEPGRNCLEDQVCKSHAYIHIYRHDGGTWQLHQTVLPDAEGIPFQDTSFPRIGNIAIDEERLVVGLPYDEACRSRTNEGIRCEAAGSVRIFDLVDGQFQPRHILVRPDSRPFEYDRFGSFVVMDSRRLFVGAPGQAAVHEFKLEAGQWQAVSIILGSESDSEFGAAIALNNDRVLIGAPSDRNCATGIAPADEEFDTRCAQGNVGPGAAFVFDKVDDAWVKQVYIKPQTQRWIAQFGDSVGFSGDALVVSSPGDTNIGSGITDETREGRSASGAVSIYVWGPQ